MSDGAECEVHGSIIPFLLLMSVPTFEAILNLEEYVYFANKLDKGEVDIVQESEDVETAREKEKNTVFMIENLSNGIEILKDVTISRISNGSPAYCPEFKLNAQVWGA